MRGDGPQGVHNFDNAVCNDGWRRSGNPGPGTPNINLVKAKLDPRLGVLALPWCGPVNALVWLPAYGLPVGIIKKAIPRMDRVTAVGAIKSTRHFCGDTS